MNITVLGSGTSTGVPEYLCDCETCDDARNSGSPNRRTRPSIYVTNGDWHFVVDCGQNFLDQIDANRVERIDTVFFTHCHADHISGVNDLVMPCRKQQSDMPIYGPDETIRILQRNYDYMFTKETFKGGGVAHLLPTVVNGPSQWNGVSVTPIPVEHGAVETIGYRFDNFGYVPDVKVLPEESLALLEGVEVLIVDALSFNPGHPTHISVGEAAKISETLGTRETYLTHISHRIDHHKFDEQCKENDIERPPNFSLAHDGLQIEV